MRHDPRASIFDMIQAARNILVFSKGKTLEDYLDDLYFRSAVERQFGILGEAMTRLRKADASLASRVPEHQKIIGFRNQLNHAYDIVDDEISWRAIQTKLPGLMLVLEQLLAALDDADNPPPVG